MKKTAPYAWGPEHNQALYSIKKEFVQAPIQYYDPKKATVLQTDASIKGLGACLLQDGHPVYFASKSLQDAECGYVTIELEALAVTWAMEKFHHFLYAPHFTLETDQKPLETILAKSLVEATSRLQWLLICTFPYDFTVWYIKGSTNQLVDCLSRLGCQKDKIQLPKLKIHAITRQLPATADRLNQFHTETAHDEKLALLKHIVQNAWPQDICDLPKEIQPYWTFHEEMTIEDGLLLKGTCIIVPHTLHPEMIQLLHTGHLGLEKCLNRAKQSMYWPGLYEELKDLVTNCTTCLKFSLQKPTCLSNRQYAGHEIPVYPWSKLASNIFYFEGDSYLLIVDNTSWFPIIRKLSSMMGKAIAHHMQAIFAECRWPDTLVTDSGPCYISKEFKMLMESMSVNHTTSSPHYPQSNGLAEKFVGIIKNLFHKAREEGQSPYTALMVYRNTPLNGSLQSPMQILQGKQARTDLPLSHAAKVKMGTNHTPGHTAEFFVQRISHYLPPHMTYLLVNMSCTENLMMVDGIQLL